MFAYNWLNKLYIYIHIIHKGFITHPMPPPRPPGPAGGLPPRSQMKQTQAAMQAKGATMTQWHIHTPICSPSRSELVSGRYFHNIKSNVPVPVLDRILYAGSDHVNGSLYANESFGVFLRQEKGYQVGLFGKSNFNTYDGFDRWFQGASLSYGAVKWEDDESPTGYYVQMQHEYLVYSANGYSTGGEYILPSPS